MKRRLKGERFLLEIGQTGYPDIFLRLKNPPKKLYGIGDPGSMREGLAVVGARRATPYGISCAETFAGIAAEKGVVIISGGARGCDSAAHRAALAKGCQTVAFLGGGCDEVYPSENFGLFQEIIDLGGAVVSENPYDFKPLGYTFRERNRLIACLAKATLIVEAGLPSGTFSTADEALAVNRDVLVVPGSITSEQSRGANRLIYQGATPVVDEDSFSDILFRIYGLLKQENIRSNCDSEFVDGCSKLYGVISAEPLGMEELSVMAKELSDSSDPLSWLMVQLANMQKAGLIAQYPDGRYGPKVKG